MTDDENIIQVDFDKPIEENNVEILSEETPTEKPNEHSRIEAESFADDLQKEIDQLADDEADDLKKAI